MSHPTDNRARSIFWLQAVSLAATGWLIWRTAFFPFGAQYFLPEGIAIALFYSCCALALSGVITFVLLLSMRHIARKEALYVTLRTSAAGMWFAPAVILLGAASPLAIAAALALVVSVTRVLFSQWHLAPAESLTEPGSEAEPRPITGELPHGFLPRDFWPAFAAAAALQAGFVFSHLAHRSLSGAAYALGAAVLTAYSISAGVWTTHRDPALPRSILAIAVTLMLTAIITLIGMQMYPGGGGEGDVAGAGSSASRATHKSQPPQPPPTPPARAQSEPPPIDPARMGPVVSVPGGVPGVILWPETRAVPLLVEPMPKGGLARRQTSQPFIIPFAGSYWMFRGGYTRPPANSLVQRGTPTTSSFKTVDAWPMEMEAHQRLDREIDLSCCAAIRIDVLNADKHPASISIELAVIDRAGRPVSLGRAPIRSAPDLYQEPIVAVAETLDFPILATNLRFDEFDVTFHRERDRADRSARISIERFALVPR